MKINLIVFLIFGFVIISSCTDKKEVEVKKVFQENSEENLRYDNPAIFMGSNFGKYLSANHRLGIDNYERLYLFTSEATKKKFGHNKLIEFYRGMQFSYRIKLTGIIDSANFKILLYRTTIDATEKTIQLKVLIENDSCRIVFDSLNKDLPFLGM